MNPAREQLIAYLATLGALVLVFVAALITGAIAPQIMEQFGELGLATICGGLIGVLRLPQARTVTVDNPPGDPVPTTETK